MRQLKVLRRYTVSSVLKVGILTALLATLMLLGVDLFSKLDTYITYMAGFPSALKVTLLYFPESFLLALGPSMLFSVTYFMSMLYANNEAMCILGSGISLRRTVRPIIVTAILISLFSFAFSEKVALDASNRRDVEYNLIMKRNSSESDSSNVAISDMHNGYMLDASLYTDKDQRLYNVTCISTGADGTLTKVSASYAQWDPQKGLWVFHEATVHTTDPANPANTTSQYLDSAIIENVSLEPELFKNHSSDITRMDVKLASSYLSRIREVNREEYASLATQFYKRVLSCLTPLVMMVIACAMNYRFKKNTMFFSLLVALCTAVVYYVVQMLTTMLAEQGVIGALWGSLIPFIMVVAISTIFSMLVNRR